MPASTANGYQSLSKETKDLIVKDFLNGFYYEDLRKKYNLTRRAPAEIIKEYGLNWIAQRKNKYSLNEHYFDKIDSNEKAYWLGYIAADGCITKTNYFAAASIDKEILDQLKIDLEYTGEVYLPKQKENRTPAYRINFSSKILCDALRKLGIHEKKSMIYNELPNIDEKYISHFIRGYFDGDGCICKHDSSYVRNNKRYFFTHVYVNIVATKNFCEALRDVFLIQLGYFAHIHKHPTKSMYYIYVHKQSALRKLFDYMYQNASFYLERKHQKFIDFVSSFDKKLSLKNGTNCWETGNNDQQPILLS